MLALALAIQVNEKDEFFLEKYDLTVHKQVMIKNNRNGKNVIDVIPDCNIGDIGRKQWNALCVIQNFNQSSNYLYTMKNIHTLNE